VDEAYRLRLSKIEAVLDAALPEKPGGPWLEGRFAPGAAAAAKHAAPLFAPGRDILSRGGKRWRPLLMVLVCEALGGADAALPLVPLVELPHNASLIHDDLEDNSSERRGRPSAHIIYGSDTAINSGSFLYFLSLSSIDAWDAPPERKYTVYSLWAGHIRRLHLGQAMDIAWHRDFSSAPDIADYDLMCRCKTGALARLAVLLGACAAGREIPENSALAGAAETLGVAFQILDDVKNLTTGNPGKKRGDDIVEGKKSLPALLFLARHPGKAPLLERCFRAAGAAGPDAPEVEELIGEFQAAGVIEEAERRGREMIAQAREVLAGTGGGEARRLLAGFAELLG
jgi:octaprenyl-diphosphate synthase